MEKTTLRDVITSIQGNPPASLNTAYMNIFGINLAYRFPFVTELESLSSTEVDSVADFSIACAIIGLERWTAIQNNTGSSGVGFSPQRGNFRPSKTG